MKIARLERRFEMLDMIILISCIIASGFIGYTAGYNYGYDDGVLYQVQKQIDEKREKLKRDCLHN